MINTLSLLIGLAGVVFVVVRATVADRAMPWFKPVPPPAAKPPGPMMGRR